MIDSHAHLNASYTAETVGVILEKFTKAGGKQVIDVTTSATDIQVSQSIIDAYSHMVSTTIGFHPESCTGDAVIFEQLCKDFHAGFSQLSLLKNVVGVGETGLDYWYLPNEQDSSSKIIEQQRQLLTLHIAEAKKHQLPLVIHARGKENHEYQVIGEIVSLLNQENYNNSAYFHSFGASRKEAKQLLDAGHYLGINGIVTYSGAKDLVEALAYIPTDRILLETDAPFLIPSNCDRSLLQDPKTNEPIGIHATAKRIAAIKRIPLEAVIELTSQATKALFARML